MSKPLTPDQAATQAALTLRVLALLPRHVQAPEWRTEIEKLPPALSFMAGVVADESAEYRHRQSQHGHKWVLRKEGAIIRVQCSCGFPGGGWKQGFGPAPGASEDEIRKAVYR